MSKVLQVMTFGASISDPPLHTFMPRNLDSWRYIYVVLCLLTTFFLAKSICYTLLERIRLSEVSIVQLVRFLMVRHAYPDSSLTRVLACTAIYSFDGRRHTRR